MAESTSAAATKKVIFVVGPTASGKSGWAFKEASRTLGSIINIDSVQFYKGLEVGSAAPTSKEKNQVPHHLYSYVEAPNEMTAGKYVTEFYKLLEKPELKFPLFIVGGTGFYIQALEKGMFDIEPVSVDIRNKLESELSENGPDILYQELIRKDPDTKIHLNDHYRIVRALEIIRATGKTPSSMKTENLLKNNLFPYPFLKVGFTFEKEIFQTRVGARTKFMIENGLLEETQYFLKNNFQNWAPLASVGYRESVQFLLENKTKDWLHENIVLSTMQLIKKQKTWFKRDATILWSEQARHIEQFLHED